MTKWDRVIPAIEGKKLMAFPRVFLSTSRLSKAYGEKNVKAHLNFLGADCILAAEQNLQLIRTAVIEARTL